MSTSISMYHLRNKPPFCIVYFRIFRKLHYGLLSCIISISNEAENDFDNLTDKQYENLRFCIIKNICALTTK